MRDRQTGRWERSGDFSFVIRHSSFVTRHFLLLLTLLIPSASWAADSLSSDTFLVDPSTLHCLSFRWYIEGDDDGDASGSIQYRAAGTVQWQDALPMLRVHNEIANQDFEPYECGNLFAGSIFGLEPGADYEVRVQLSDPDGGSFEQTVTLTTRSEPVLPEPTRELHVYPAGYEGPQQTPSAASLAAAVTGLAPGHHVVLHAGSYSIGPIGLRVATSGTEATPIVFRGAGDGDVTIDAQGATSAFDIISTDHLWFEDIQIRNAKWGIRADKAIGLIVRRCRIENTEWAISTFSAESEGWYIADNTLIGSNESWYPRQSDNLPSYTGVNVYGRGHVVCHNRISDFWDGIAIADHNRPVDDRNLHCFAIDFYNNDISNAIDDGIESDYGSHNIRVFNNRIINAHTALSAQPTYGGPIYFIRNVAYGITSLNLKLHNTCTGLEIYHNTLVSANQAFQSDRRWQNGTLRNNLLLGAQRYAIETGSPHPSTSLDYNGYHQPDPTRFFKWWDGVTEDRYLSLAELAAATGHESHGVKIDFDVFQSASAPAEGQSYSFPDIDLRLTASATAVDRGIALPTVNEDFAGTAPDLGAYEVGRPLPQYGPRPATVSGNTSDFDGSGRVEFADFLLFAAAFGSSAGNEGFDTRFDLSGNGVVDFPDFLTFAQAFGTASASRPEAPRTA